MATELAVQYWFVDEVFIIYFVTTYNEKRQHHSLYHKSHCLKTTFKSGYINISRDFLPQDRDLHLLRQDQVVQNNISRQSQNWDSWDRYLRWQSAIAKGRNRKGPLSQRSAIAKVAIAMWCINFCILALGSGQRLLYRLGSGLRLVLVLVLRFCMCPADFCDSGPLR